MQRRELGKIVLELGLVDELQLRAALHYQQQWGMPLGKALVEKGFVSEADVLRALSVQTGMQSIDLDAEKLDPALAPLVPVKAAERHRVVPLRTEGKRNEVLVVAIGAPAKWETLDQLRAVSNKQRVVAYVAADSALDRAIAELYAGRPRPPKGAEPPRPRAAKVENETEFELEEAPASAKPVSAPAPAPAPVPAAVPAAVPAGSAATGAAASKPGKTWLYGWHDSRERALLQMLKLAELDAAPLQEEALARCGREDVIITTTLALQTALPPGQRVKAGRLIICGLAEDQDLAEARGFGIRMYLRPPFSPEQLAKAVREVASQPA